MTSEDLQSNIHVLSFLNADIICSTTQCAIILDGQESATKFLQTPIHTVTIQQLMAKSSINLKCVGQAAWSAAEAGDLKLSAFLLICLFLSSQGLIWQSTYTYHFQRMFIQNSEKRIEENSFQEVHQLLINSVR